MERLRVFCEEGNKPQKQGILRNAGWHCDFGLGLRLKPAADPPPLLCDPKTQLFRLSDTGMADFMVQNVKRTQLN